MKHGVWFLLLVMMLMAGCGSAAVSHRQTKDTPNTNVGESETVLTVSAAASMKDSLEEIQTAFEKKHSNISLVFNFGGSGSLRQQIENGAPSDLFISADAGHMDALVKEHLIDSKWRKDLVSNTLVVIVPKNKTTIKGLHDLIQPAYRIFAVGTPETVPAGEYAKAALQHVKLWDALQSKMVFTKDVRQTLTVVETGNADAGIVYKTDALSSNKVSIALNIDPGCYEPIRYPVGIVSSSKHMKEAELFYQFLSSEDALQLFEKFGFIQIKAEKP